VWNGTIPIDNLVYETDTDDHWEEKLLKIWSNAGVCLVSPGGYGVKKGQGAGQVLRFWASGRTFGPMGIPFHGKIFLFFPEGKELNWMGTTATYQMER